MAEWREFAKQDINFGLEEARGSFVGMEGLAN
jgi:hypothetical protein